MGYMLRKENNWTRITKAAIIIVRKLYSCYKLAVFKCFKINKINTFSSDFFFIFSFNDGYLPCF